MARKDSISRRWEGLQKRARFFAEHFILACLRFGLTPFVLTQTVPPAEGLQIGAPLIHEQSFGGLDQGEGVTRTEPTAFNDLSWDDDFAFRINSQIFYLDCPYRRCTGLAVVPVQVGRIS